MAAALLASSVMMSSCGGSGEIKFKNFRDSIAEGKGNNVSFAVTSIDFPVKGDKQVVSAITDWIVMYTQGHLDGDKYKKYVADVNKKIFSVPESGDAGFGGYENSFELHKSFETNKLITMLGLSYTYLGGAHGVHKSVGVTFRKSDGTAFDKEMIADYNSVGFKKLIKKYMMEYFEVNDYESLRSCLFEEGLEVDPSGDWWVKLPGSFLPYIDEEGRVVVMYGLYEIAPYASGEVEACIPYEEIKDRLTEEGKAYF